MNTNFSSPQYDYDDFAMDQEDNSFYETFSFWINGIISLVLVIIGTLGNAAVVLSLHCRRKSETQTRRRRQAFYFYLMTFAFWNTGLLIATVLFNCIPVLYRSNPNLRVIADVTFLIGYPLGNCCLTANVWLAVVVTVERYLAVSLPFHSTRLTSPRRRAKTISIILSLGAILYSLPLLFELSLNQRPVLESMDYSSHAGQHYRVRDGNETDFVETSIPTSSSPFPEAETLSDINDAHGRTGVPSGTARHVARRSLLHLISDKKLISQLLTVEARQATKSDKVDFETSSNGRLDYWKKSRWNSMLHEGSDKRSLLQSMLEENTTKTVRYRKLRTTDKHTDNGLGLIFSPMHRFRRSNDLLSEADPYSSPGLSLISHMDTATTLSPAHSDSRADQAAVTAVYEVRMSSMRDNVYYQFVYRVLGNMLFVSGLPFLIVLLLTVKIVCLVRESDRRREHFRQQSKPNIDRLDVNRVRFVQAGISQLSGPIKMDKLPIDRLKIDRSQTDQSIASSSNRPSIIDTRNIDRPCPEVNRSYQRLSDLRSVDPTAPTFPSQRPDINRSTCHLPPKSVSVDQPSPKITRVRNMVRSITQDQKPSQTSTKRLVSPPTAPQAPSPVPPPSPWRHAHVVLTLIAAKFLLCYSLPVAINIVELTSDRRKFDHEQSVWSKVLAVMVDLSNLLIVLDGSTNAFFYFSWWRSRSRIRLRDRFTGKRKRPENQSGQENEQTSALLRRQERKQEMRVPTAHQKLKPGLAMVQTMDSVELSEGGQGTTAENGSAGCSQTSVF